ncbi:MAG TPA: CinA family protein [Nocardioidaceae bacterium]|nr:CinA family protein [Nocardioidaceae bacterium]
MDAPRLSDEAFQTAQDIARVARETGIMVATAESLTSGQIACHLGAASESSHWFKGAVIAYDNDVKYKVLGVPAGPVVTAECAEAMARGCRDLLEADIAVAVTGVGGPSEEEGRPPGCVYVALVSGESAKVEHHQFDGEPLEVLVATTQCALSMLHERVAAASAGR